MSIAASMNFKVKPELSVKYYCCCLIEACLSQLKRSYFDFHDNLDSQYWRDKVVDTLENSHISYNLFTPTVAS